MASIKKTNVRNLSTFYGFELFSCVDSCDSIRLLPSRSHRFFAPILPVGSSSIEQFFICLFSNFLLFNRRGWISRGHWKRSYFPLDWFSPPQLSYLRSLRSTPKGSIHDKSSILMANRRFGFNVRESFAGAAFVAVSHPSCDDMRTGSIHRHDKDALRSKFHY